MPETAEEDLPGGSVLLDYDATVSHPEIPQWRIIHPVHARMYDGRMVSLGNIWGFDLSVSCDEPMPRTRLVVTNGGDRVRFDPIRAEVLFRKVNRAIGDAMPVCWDKPLPPCAAGPLTLSPDRPGVRGLDYRVLDSAGGEVSRIAGLHVSLTCQDDTGPSVVVVLACPPDDDLDDPQDGYHRRSRHYARNPHPAFPQTAQEVSPA